MRYVNYITLRAFHCQGYDGRSGTWTELDVPENAIVQRGWSIVPIVDGEFLFYNGYMIESRYSPFDETLVRPESQTALARYRDEHPYRAEIEDRYHK